MKGKSFNKVALVISVFVFFYFGYQLISYSTTEPYKTQQALLYEYDDMIKLTGVVVKDEKLIESTYSGIVKYEYANAEKVKKNTVVAKTYETEGDLINDNIINSYTLHKNILQAINNTKISNVQSVISSVEKSLDSILLNLNRGSFENIYAEEYNLLNLMAQQELILFPSTSYDQTIETLNGNIESLQSNVTGEHLDILSSNSGYFTSLVDGYENFITMDTINDLDMASFNELLSVKPLVNNSYIGKIIESTNWCFVATAPGEALSEFKINSKYYLKFNSMGYKVPVTISELTYDADSDKTLVKLTCKILNEQLINLRKQDAYISKYEKTNVGLKISTDAIRLNDEQQKGVYVDVNNVAKFKKIDIIYKSDDYVIVALNEQKDYVQLYDEVIVLGKDLYDEKPI